MSTNTESSIQEADEFEADDSRPLQELRRLVGGACSDCRRRHSTRDAVYSIVMGFKNAPRCLPCLSSRLGRSANELGSELVAHIHRRECFLKAWREAERMDASEPTASNVVGPNQAQFMETAPTIAAEWDAGDMGCGELVMALRLRLNDMPGGAVLKIRATDPAAPEDLPAWCRMSGHTLLFVQHPTYFIRRKGA